MKKLIALMLALCLFLSVTALAEGRSAVQDEMPPMPVAQVSDDGEVIVAKIMNPAGEMIAGVKADGSLVLTDVQHRSTASTEIIIIRLTDAYESVMADVHHSDVPCSEHGEHDVKVDINKALESLEDDIDAYDLVMYELYDVALTPSVEELLVDGNYMEVTFELVESESLPIITLFTKDGIAWEVLPTITAGHNRFTVHLTEVGTIALLEDGRQTLKIGKEVVHEEVLPFEGEDDLEYHGSIFTPSVTGKPAPTINYIEGEDGEILVSYITIEETEEKVSVPNRNFIIVTSVAERAFARDIQTYEHLEWGFDSIVKAEHVGELFTEHDMTVTLEDHQHTTLNDMLQSALDEMGVDLTPDQLAVKDLFEVTAYGDYLVPMYGENSYMTVSFKSDLDPAKPFVIIHSYDSKHWHVHPVEEAHIDGNGNVTMHMHALGVVAFLVENETVIDAEDAVQSPD